MNKINKLSASILWLFFLLFSCTTEDEQKVKLLLSVIPENGGYCNISPYDYSAGSEVTIEAIANDGYVFEGWEGDLQSKETPYSFVINRDLNINAKFKKYPKVKIEKVGEGEVISDISYDRDNCTFLAKLYAKPQITWNFQKWDGYIQGEDNPISFNFNDDIYIKAYFKELEREFNGPQILSYEFSPTLIDITTSNQIITITAHVTDESGVNEAPIVYVQNQENVSATQQTGYFKLTSGTNKDGIYTAQIEIPKGLQPGEWEISSNSFYDIFRNSSIWPVYPTTDKKTLTVVNNIKSDFEGPQILSYEFSPTLIDITTSNQIITITAHVTDESGVNEAPIVYVQNQENVSATQQTGYFKLTSGTNKDGIYTAQIEIPKGLQPGEWEISSNSFYDIFRNSSIWPVYPTTDKKTLTVVNTRQGH